MERVILEAFMNYSYMKNFSHPSAGIKTFGYDQWGNSNKETDASGKITDIV